MGQYLCIGIYTKVRVRRKDLEWQIKDEMERHEIIQKELSRWRGNVAKLKLTNTVFYLIKVSLI